MLKFLSCFFLLAMVTGSSFGQEKEVEGIVFDKDTRNRVTRVNLRNLRTGVAVFNTIKGEFKLAVKPGDKIIAAVSGYKLDTITYEQQTAVLFYLQRIAIPLREILVRDSILSAKKRYEETRRDFNSLNRIGNNKDLLSIGNSTVGLSIDAIWSAFSRQGRNARRLMEVMERDYMNAYVDEKFSKKLVSTVTGLKNSDLEVFMRHYRPSYYFLSGASEYDLVTYIKMAHMRFGKDRYRDDVSTLKPIE